jgi:hypothetical protein
MSHPPGKDEYTVVVVQRKRFPIQWEWEIYRDGKPLPIRLRQGNFRTNAAALAAGSIALRQFLKALAREQNT